MAEKSGHSGRMKAADHNKPWGGARRNPARGLLEKHVAARFGNPIKVFSRGDTRLHVRGGRNSRSRLKIGLIPIRRQFKPQQSFYAIQLAEKFVRFRQMHRALNSSG